MAGRGKLAAAIVAGGVGLGAILGAAAHPVMKQVPGRAPPMALQAPPENAGPVWAEALPENRSPYQDSYAPSWADEELGYQEPAYPEWTYSDLRDDRFDDPPRVEDAPVAARAMPVAAEAPAPPEASPPPADPPIARQPPAPARFAGLY